jgi:SRSO17 transposase
MVELEWIFKHSAVRRGFRLLSVIGHADRVKPLRDYCLGLMMPCERKSVEPVAAVTAPERTAHNISRCCISSAKGAGRMRRY